MIIKNKSFTVSSTSGKKLSQRTGNCADNTRTLSGRVAPILRNVVNNQNHVFLYVYVSYRKHIETLQYMTIKF